MKRNRTIALCLLMAFLSSCSMEKQLAKDFVQKTKDVQVAVYFPETAKVESQYNAELGKATSVLDGFDSDLFLDVMYVSYARTLEEYGLSVYIPESSNDVQVDSVHWLVTLQNVEVIGKIIEYEDYLFDNYGERFYKHNLNAVNVASWFEMNNGDWLPVQFFECTLTDGYKSKSKGGFWSMPDYSFSVDTLTLAKVYDYAVYLGKLYAEYTFDCFMNKHIEEEFRRYDAQPALYLRYDPYRKMYIYMYFDDEEKFVEIVD